MLVEAAKLHIFSNYFTYLGNTPTLVGSCVTNARKPNSKQVSIIMLSLTIIANIKDHFK